MHKKLLIDLLRLIVFSINYFILFFFFFSSRRRHTRCGRDWSSDVCSSDLQEVQIIIDGNTYSISKNENFALSDYYSEKKPLTQIKYRIIFSNESQAVKSRSEERRVGKECRSRWSPDH